MECPQGRMQRGLNLGAPDGIVSSRVCDARITNETELGVLKSSINPISTGINANIGTIPCRNGACSKPRSGQTLDSPWHRLKSIFLVSMIAAFLVWLIVFVLLLRYEML
ncbi:hypothetical protein QAD02_005659 [Eretmocerus hayati]|uniref:Uncharacterized protein n=1 Tax=Eretmocerus hayati TaxID=131215 RepID=A0ACC2NW08_9HYME|nr:hypothetical protein QAD02_005659 [Eretmocerus hayati]